MCKSLFKNTQGKNIILYTVALIALSAGLDLHGSPVIVGAAVGVSGFVVKDLITDNAKLSSKISNYDRLYKRVYANEVYNVHHYMKSDSTAEGDLKYTWTTSVIRVIDKKVVYRGESTNAFMPTANAFPSYESQFKDTIPSSVPLEIRNASCQIDPSWKESLTTVFAYRISWEFNGTPMWYWRRQRDFRVKCLNWRNQKTNCEEDFKGGGAEYLTEFPIPVNVKPGGLIWCKSYVAGPPGWELGVVNIDPGDNGHIVFEVVQ